ncbi:MAG: hypothetical protein ABIT71_03745 [Vicinamibacteraceae bacterium]
MTTMTRGAALGGLMALMFTVACGDSPTRPSPQLPATLEMTGNQTVRVDGTNLQITVDVPPSRCGAADSCLAWYGTRLIARVDGAPPVELEVRLDGHPVQRRVGRYTVSFIGFLWNPARIQVLVEGS